MRTFSSAQEIQGAVGEVLGTSDWLTVEQERIDQFAEATGDHQWIHVDQEKAAQGPFGTTIAHGYLTLSLIPQFAWQVFSIERAKMGVNYGLNKARFISPVKVGSRLRCTSQLLEATEVPGGLQLVVQQTLEIEGAEKPACVAETVSRVYF